VRLNMGIGFIINLLCPDLLFRNRVNNARRIISAIFPNLIAFMEILFRAYRDYSMTRPVHLFYVISAAFISHKTNLCAI